METAARCAFAPSSPSKAASQFRADPIGAEIKEWVEFLELFSHFPEMDEEDE